MDRPSSLSVVSAFDFEDLVKAIDATTIFDFFKEYLAHIRDFASGRTRIVEGRQRVGRMILFINTLIQGTLLQQRCIKD